MNANEVIANRALEHIGAALGSYEVIHPNDHVNASQSTSDVYPTALHLAAWNGIESLLTAMADLRQAFEAKAEEFRAVLKIGRTHLQDAVPMTLGQEFLTFAIMIGEDEARLREARELIAEVNLGATAIGTSINAPAGYCETVIPLLAEASGIPVVRAAISSKLLRIPAHSGRSQGCSNGSHASCRRFPTTCVCSPPDRRLASETSSCRRVKLALRSCLERSIRSSQR
mgnify:CR=1 FL=1